MNRQTSLREASHHNCEGLFTSASTWQTILSEHSTFGVPIFEGFSIHATSNVFRYRLSNTIEEINVTQLECIVIFNKKLSSLLVT